MTQRRRTDLAETTSITARDIFDAHGMPDQDPGSAFEIDGRQFISMDTMLQVTSAKGDPIGLCINKLGVNSVFPQQFCMFTDGTTRALNDDVYHVVEFFDPDAEVSLSDSDDGPTC
jgi:hypothetical protein